MTYCVGLLLNAGMVLLSDTRTNAGLDNIATYRKMFTFEDPGERVIAIMTAGSLSVTQTTIARLREAIDDPEADARDSILLAPDHAEGGRDRRQHAGRGAGEIDEKMSRWAGRQRQHDRGGPAKGGAMRLFLIYPEGNFIEATEDTPFLQIGEHKYGKPILDRVVKPDDQPADAQKAVLLSMDSTLRSNLSVGMPLDLAVIERDACRVTARAGSRRDESFRAMSEPGRTRRCATGSSGRAGQQSRCPPTLVHRKGPFFCAPCSFSSTPDTARLRGSGVPARLRKADARNSSARAGRRCGAGRARPRRSTAGRPS
jgi:putative proteasome-type protease